MSAAPGNTHGFRPGNRGFVPVQWRYSKANRMREQSQMKALKRR